DVYIGSAKRQPSVLLLQQPNGTLKDVTPVAILQDSLYEEVDAVFADVDQDGDPDLIIGSGGNEYRLNSAETQARLFLNDGKGQFSKSDALDAFHLQAACILAEDFDQDGKVDLYLGARCQSWNYGLPPTSFLLKNKGNGQFEDVTAQLAPALQEAGMVKGGQFVDLDQDGDPDLVLAMEWQPIQVFVNEEGHFSPKTLHPASGWWNFVAVQDLDQDGDLDILAGNLGENNKFAPSPEEPLRLYINDFDDNGQIEQILTYYLHGKELPFANFAELTRTLVKLKKDYLYSKDLAKASLEDIFGAEKLKSSLLLTADEMHSVWLENKGGNLDFDLHRLPDALQLAPLNAGLPINPDGDFLLGGNFLESNIEMGWYDADMGNVLQIDTSRQMHVHPLGQIRLKGQVRQIKALHIGGQTVYLIAINDKKMVALRADGSR
ncbi:MAG: VCBS repeat-containing protein, partial [Phaeodactylibacter sp.]|nr:VCBS repeat-containing protein [Phaeodactylibacter sp.]